MENKQGNILGTQPIGQLLLKFAVPSIIAMQVSALYNIVAVSYTHLDVYKRQMLHRHYKER